MTCRYIQNGFEPRSDSNNNSIRNQAYILRIMCLVVKVYFLIKEACLPLVAELVGQIN